MAHIDQWTACNNLHLNRFKSFELIFRSHRQRLDPTLVLREMSGITRVKKLKCLGVTLSDNFDFNEHVSEVICSTAQSLYALLTLRANGMHDTQLVTVFKATALAKLLYSSPA